MNRNAMEKVDHMLGKEIPELMKMLVKEKREEGLELKGITNRETKDSYVSLIVMKFYNRS